MRIMHCLAAAGQAAGLTALAAAAAIHDVLTAEQKKAWKEMLGEPFDTTGFGFQPAIGRR